MVCSSWIKIDLRNPNEDLKMSLPFPFPNTFKGNRHLQSWTRELPFQALYVLSVSKELCLMPES